MYPPSPFVFDGALLREFVDPSTFIEEASNKYEAVGKLSLDRVKVRNEGFALWAFCDLKTEGADGNERCSV